MDFQHYLELLCHRVQKHELGYLQLKIEEVENAMEQLALKEVVIKEKDDKIDELRNVDSTEEERKKNEEERQKERIKDLKVILRQEKYIMTP